MRISFGVPKWAIGKHIYIFAGSELLGEKQARVIHEGGKHVIKYLPLKIKQEDGRCNGCGVCCRDCPFISPSGCSFKNKIPFSCARSVCTHFEGCTEKFVEVVE